MPQEVKHVVRALWCRFDPGHFSMEFYCYEGPSAGKYACSLDLTMHGVTFSTDAEKDCVVWPASLAHLPPVKPDLIKAFVDAAAHIPYSAVCDNCKNFCSRLW